MSVKTNMADKCLQHKMWIIFFYIFTTVIAKSNTNIYHYNVDTSNLVLNDLSDHEIVRRETNIKETKILPDYATLNSTSTSSTTTTPKTLTNKNVTTFIPHNLGVNGTGQRKDVLKTETDKLSVDKSVMLGKTAKPEFTSTTTLAPKINLTVDDDDFAISHHTDEIINKTIETYNNTDKKLKTEVDDHEYYTSKFTVDPTVGMAHWVNMTNMKDVKVNELLSDSHRRAATVKLNFDFPFYGHIVRNVTIATGGFLYTGEYVHSWLAATQYIAPLMANFDTSLSNDSLIKYVDNGTAFTVQWEKVLLQDKPLDGEFTFQVTLHKNGDIVFVYQNVPIIIENIQDEYHPVKVGLSDAYIIDRTIFFVRRKTIYEYHRVNFKKEDIKNWTVIYLNALPTCLSNKNCTSCLSKTSKFECMWCPGTQRCSNGMDRHRQEWLLKGCERIQLKNISQCSNQDTDKSSRFGYATEDKDRSVVDDAPEHASRVTHDEDERVKKKSASVGVSGVLSILFVVGLLASLGMWVLYAYRNPHSASGQLLIRRGKGFFEEYRPSQWSWRRGEARYTAATIHM